MKPETASPAACRGLAPRGSLVYIYMVQSRTSLLGVNILVENPKPLWFSAVSIPHIGIKDPLGLVSSRKGFERGSFRLSM